MECVFFTLGGFRFYTECLGMKLLRKRDIPEERYTNAFLGYGPEDSHFVVELTYSKALTMCLFGYNYKLIGAYLLEKHTR